MGSVLRRPGPRAGAGAHAIAALFGLLVTMLGLATLSADAAARPTGGAEKAAKATAAALKEKADLAATELGKPGDVVAFKASYPVGAIVVVNEERRLYYVLGKGRAIRYPVAVGRTDEIWTGKSFVQAKVKNPEWVPVDDPERRVPPGPDNPLGERALYLGWTLYRIHGTNSPRSIGNAASAGCVRMHNYHVKDLFERVHIGAPVFVVDALTSGRNDSRPRKMASR